MKALILKLRAQGHTYKYIAATVHCSNSTVAFYCAHNGQANAQQRKANRSRKKNIVKEIEVIKEVKKPRKLPKRKEKLYKRLPPKPFIDITEDFFTKERKRLGL